MCVHACCLHQVTAATLPDAPWLQGTRAGSKGVYLEDHCIMNGCTESCAYVRPRVLTACMYVWTTACMPTARRTCVLPTLWIGIGIEWMDVCVYVVGWMMTFRRRRRWTGCTMTMMMMMETFLRWFGTLSRD